MLNKKINKTKIFWTLFYIFIFCLLIKNSYSYLDPDLGWHLRVGKDILINKSVPHIENYNFTLKGERWVDHEWLINLISFFIFNKFSYLILNIFFALIVLVLLISQHYFIYKYKRYNPWVYISLSLIGIFAISPHIGVRMQEITLLALFLLYLIIFLFQKTKNIKYLLALPLLFYFWSCLHGGFLIGLFLLGLFIAIKILEIISTRFNFSFIDYSEKLKLKETIIFGFFSILSFLATLITPYKLELYSFLNSYQNTYYLKHIAEWLPMFYYKIFYYQLIYLAIASALIFVHLYFSFKRKYFKINLWQYALIALFFILSFKSKRHFPLFFVISLPFLVDIFTTYFNLSKNIFNKLTKHFFIQTCFYLSLILISTAIIFKTNFTNRPFANQQFCKNNPCAALEYLKSNTRYKELAIFNNYGWGGFLVWSWPESKIFIDGRLPQIIINKHSFLEEYYEFFNEDKLETKLEEYGINYVLLKKSKEIKFNWIERNIFKFKEIEIKDDNLIKYLKKNEQWEKTFEDDISMIFLKNGN